MEITQGMSENRCNYCDAGKEKGRKKQESQNPPQKESYSNLAAFLGRHRLDE